MTLIQSMIRAFINDVNDENGFFLRFAENTTAFLFRLIKWAGIPFLLFILIAFSKL